LGRSSGPISLRGAEADGDDGPSPAASPTKLDFPVVTGGDMHGRWINPIGGLGYMEHGPIDPTSTIFANQFAKQ
jgi:hypothetical protein